MKADHVGFVDDSGGAVLRGGDMLSCRAARKYRRQTAWAATRLVALTLLLLFASATVFAQTPTSVQCLPSEIGGLGGPFYVVSNDKGRAVWWRCPDSGIRTIAKLDGYLPPFGCLSPFDEFMKGIKETANDYLAAFNLALQRCRTSTPIGSPDEVQLNVLFDLAKADAKRVYPPPAIWVVAKNAALATRPAYTISVTGALGVSAVRAPVDAFCDCKTPFVKGTSTYCIFNNSVDPAVYSTAEVALCVKR